jgi:1-acyl-sn-glycerol-3-phosphate acyltransferase
MGLWLTLFCILLLIVYDEIHLRILAIAVGGDIETKLNHFGRAQVNFFSRMLRMARVYAGLRINMDPAQKFELPKTFIVVSNHQSLVDIAVLACALPRHTVCFVAKKELKFGIPAFSFSLRNGGHALINRAGDFKNTYRELTKLAKRTRYGACPAVFPEGTRSQDGRVRRFHSAAIRILMAYAQVPLVSIAMNGGYQISCLKDLIRNLSSCVYQVKILSIYPWAKNRQGVQEIIKKTEAEISAQVRLWQQK